MSTTDRVRTRFAPSPTGYMHIGGMRTALYAYCFAKKHNGSFLLRIEDTDSSREVVGANDIIYSSLKAAGLYYDEGPDIGGNYGPYKQSERKDIYHKEIKKLIDSGHAYYCFCTKDRLQQMHDQGHAKYDKRCLAIDKTLAAERACTEPHVIRQNIPAVGVSSFEDLVFGTISVQNKELEDNILIKTDGMPTYNFANVVDDYMMRITHVIRGVEYLSSTPKYNLLYDALGYKRPHYIHLQPIMRDACHKLSKRHGDASFEQFVSQGYLKEAIINYIALLGWSPRKEREKFTLQEIVDMFDIEGISKSSSIFDINKMRWLNRLYISQLSKDQFFDLAEPYLLKAQSNWRFQVDLKYLATLLQSRCEILSDIYTLTDFVANDTVDLSLLLSSKQKLDAANTIDILDRLIFALQQDDWQDKVPKIAHDTGYKVGQIMWVLRVSVTGASVTAGGATDMVKLFGTDISIKRLQKVRSQLA